MRAITLLTTALCLMVLMLLNTARAGTWQQLGELPAGPGSVDDLVIDDIGTPWVMVHDKVMWWSGDTWRVLRREDGDPFSSGVYATRLYGGPRHGAWMSTDGERDQQGQLYRIQRGGARRVTSFYYSRSTDYPGLYVSRSGTVFNFGKRFIAVLQDGDWRRVETPMAATPGKLAIADLGPDGPVVFVPRKAEHAVIWDGERLHADVKMPALPEQAGPGTTDWPLKGCNWGKNRMMFWRRHSPMKQLVVLKVKDARLIRVKKKPFLDALNPEAENHDMRPMQDGAVWVTTDPPGEPGERMYRISPRGQVTKLPDRLPRVLGTHFFKWSWHSNWANGWLQTGTGMVWLGLDKGGIVQVHGQSVKRFDWEQGITSGLEHIDEGPEGAVYAAGSQVYRWQANHDGIGWEHYALQRNQPPVAGPHGRVWAFLREHPEHVSMWNGKRWRHHPIPFTHDRWVSGIVDGEGHFLFTRWNKDGLTYVISPDGEVTRHKHLKQALGSRVEAGVTQFERPQETDRIGPVVDANHRIWFGPSERRLYGRFEQGWSQLDLKDLVTITTNPETGRAWFATESAWWIYKKGRFVRQTPQSPNHRVHLAPRRGDYLLPYDPSLPEPLLKRFCILSDEGGNEKRNWLPVTRKQARQLVAGQGWQRPEALRDTSLNYPSRARPARGGGWWIAEGNTMLMRAFRNTTLRAQTKGMPLEDIDYEGIGVDRKDQVWIDGGNFPNGRHLFIRQLRRPRLRLLEHRVQAGRNLRLRWRSNQHTRRILYRYGTDPRWHVGPPIGKKTWYAGKAGRHTRRLVMKPLDAVGVTGATIRRRFTFNTTLPELSWRQPPPDRLRSPVWRPAVKVGWTDRAQQRQIQYRLGDGEWQSLEQNKPINFAALAARETVVVRFRATEDRHYHSNILKKRISLGFELRPWIDRQIDIIATGHDHEASKALQNLKAIGERAQRAVQTELRRRRDGLQRLKRLQADLNEDRAD